MTTYQTPAEIETNQAREWLTQSRIAVDRARARVRRARTRPTRERAMEAEEEAGITLRAAEMSWATIHETAPDLRAACAVGLMLAGN